MDSKEFNELKDFYQLRNEFKVEKFIELNPNLIIILNELKAPLKLNFPMGSSYYQLTGILKLPKKHC